MTDLCSLSLNLFSGLMIFSPSYWSWLSFSKEYKAFWEWSFALGSTCGILFLDNTYLLLTHISIGTQRYITETFYLLDNHKCLCCRLLQRIIGAPWGHYAKLVHALVLLCHFIWQFPQKMIPTGEYSWLSFSTPLPSSFHNQPHAAGCAELFWNIFESTMLVVARAPKLQLWWYSVSLLETRSIFYIEFRTY